MTTLDLSTLEFPRHVHRPSMPGAWVYRVVSSSADCAQALAEGWSLTPILLGSEPVPETPPASDPPVDDAIPPVVTAEEQPAAPDGVVAKRKPGRPRKAAV